MQSGAMCYYNNDSKNKSVLYNWYVFTNTSGIAPVGWHIPSDDEWTTLEFYLDGFFAGGRMK